MKIRLLFLSLLLAWLVLPCLAAEYDFSSFPSGVLTDCTLVLESGNYVTLACIQPKTAAYLYLADELLMHYFPVTYPPYICYFYGNIYGGSMYTCMVYAPWNETHLINVNKALVNSGYATMTDFTLYDWSLYKEVAIVIPEFSSFLIIPFLMAAALWPSWFFRRKTSERRKPE